MPRGNPVPGFDYTTGRQVSMTPAEWRAKYPPATHVRRTGIAQGETWYNARSNGSRLAAEVYAIIPEGK